MREKGKSRKLSQEVIAIIQERDDSSLTTEMAMEAGKWSSSMCILKVELIEYVDGPDVEHERKMSRTTVMVLAK